MSEFRIARVSTNIPFLRALLRSPAFAAGSVHTRFIEAAEIAGPEDTTGVPAPLQGTIVNIAVAVGDAVRAAIRC